MIRCIAVYPADRPSSKAKQWEQYIKQAKANGFQEVFSTIHLPEFTLEKQIDSLLVLSELVHRYEMDLCVDIGGSYIAEILKNKELLQTIRKCRIDTVRLDYGYHHDQIAALYRKLKLKGFVLNASIYSAEEAEQEIQFLQSISSSLSIKGCHNFYPMPETGLDAEFAKEQDRVFKKYRLPVFYCIPSMTNPRGPMLAGLPTIEKHRYADIENIMLDLIHSFDCDAIMLADEFCDESEFERINVILEKKPIAIPVLFYKISAEEKEIVLQNHLFRYDSNSIILRSQTSREMACFAQPIIPCSCTKRHAGDIVILNRNAKRYSGEMQIAECEMPRSTMMNVIGRIDQQSMELLSYCRFGYTYDFSEKD